ncbi:phage terminase small subunit P27 family [Thalassoglobus sp.]|uniref:phage terminase small subunit P27 family n=1 Tax=Thalassoglobus sp. TaxID=2795869 RepID=UPI003AA9419F
MAQKTPPTWLSTTAKSYWRKLFARCESDELLAVFCTALAQYRQASEEVDREGFLIPNVSGGMKQNPATYVMKDSFVQIHRLRDIIQAADEDEDDDELNAIFGE